MGDDRPEWLVEAMAPFDRSLALIEVAAASARKAREVMPEHRPKGFDRRIEQAVEMLSILGGMIETGFYVCPHCYRTTFYPNDIRHRFCGSCKWFEDGSTPIIGKPFTSGESHK